MNNNIDLGMDDTLDNEKNDFESMVILRNNLAVAPMDTLKEIYSDMDEYINFLDSMAVLSQNDSGYLLLSNEFYDRIFQIIDIHRFDGDELVKRVANDTISYVNGIKSMSDNLKTTMLIQYKNYQEDLREVNFDSFQDLLCSVAYDAVVLYAITKNKLELIDNEDYFLYSINYIMKCFPEYFYDEEVKKRVIDCLNIIHNNQKLLSVDKKRFTKSIASNIQKIKKKEE